MILIIDGYNLILHPAWPEVKGSLEDRRNHLINQLIRYRKLDSISRLVLVFDGSQGVCDFSPRSHRQGVEIIYALEADKADGKIISLSHQWNDVQVVTADRGLARKARRNKAIIIPPEIFMRNLFRSLSRESKEVCEDGENKLDADEWLNIFEMEEEISIPPVPTQHNKTRFPSVPPRNKTPKKNKGSSPKEGERESPLGDMSVQEWMEWMGLEEE